MIKLATQLESEVDLINEKRREYFHDSNLEDISIDEKIIAIYDDTSDGFMLIEFGLFNEKTPTETPYWRVMCFKASLLSVRDFIKTLALELQARGHSTTPVYWQKQLNVLREQAVNLLLSPREKIMNNAKFRVYTAAEALTKI